MFDPAYSSSASTTLSLLRAVVSLAVTLGIMVLVAWVWKRYGQPFGSKFGLAQSSTKAPPRLSVLETRRLNPTTTLHLVKDGDTEHLIATTAAQTTLISTRPAAKPAKIKS